jgi:hypothetical protein
MTPLHSGQNTFQMAKNQNFHVQANVRLPAAPCPTLSLKLLLQATIELKHGTHTVHNAQKGPKTAKNGQKWPKMAQNDQNGKKKQKNRKRGQNRKKQLDCIFGRKWSQMLRNDHILA